MRPQRYIGNRDARFRNNAVAPIINALATRFSKELKTDAPSESVA